MANKKDQHIVPRCYLKQFVDSSIEGDNSQFEAGVFVNSSALDGPWKMKGVNNGIFTKTRFYNLKSDDPDKPLVEDYLGKLESSYTSAITRLLNNEFSNEILSIFTLFAMIQFLRTERTLKAHQESWDRVASYADMFEGGERNRRLYGEISKKQLLHLAEPKTLNPIHEKSGIIINSTQIPFLTSDMPVVRKSYNLEDISDVFRPLQQSRYDNDHLESIFYFMPLTPWLAYISHNSFGGEQKGFECPHEDVISKLNDMMLLNACEYIYSFMDNPVTSLPAETELSSNTNSFLVKVFTQSRRITFESESYEHDPFLLTLDAVNCDFFDEFYEGQQIFLVEVFDLDFSSVIGVACTRNCKVKAIDKLSKKVAFETNRG